MKHPIWLLLVSALIAVAVYLPGLGGPFLFDDHVHITQNRWVKIDSLGLDDLTRAWDSSFSHFPSDRPLAQLSFGINHAVAGLDPRAFKATNLAIHLLTGLLIYVLVRLIYRVLRPDGGDPRQAQMLAFATAALWLLHPLHVSTVLYTVQRMAQISALALFAALACYFWGRIRLSEGRPALGWILAAPAIAVFGFFGKESTALLPLLLLVSEATVLRRLPAPDRPATLRVIKLLFIALPLVAAVVYFSQHPSYFNHDGRAFSLEERVLTQPRVLWLYLQWLLIPDITQMGLFHDDIRISTGLTEPPTTLLAIVALAVLAGAAVVLRRRAPLFAFGVLFFLAGHTLESSIFPLEMVFEHRNYLPSLGPLLLLAYVLVMAFDRPGAGLLLRGFALALLLIYSAATFVRVGEWSSQESFILSAAENHPRSPRANFMAAQLLISNLGQPGVDNEKLAAAARTFLDSGLEADPRCINCLFGLLVLDLHLDVQPDPAIVQRLADSLRSGHVDATNASVSQFSYLVKWQQSDGIRFAPGQIESIFDAALANPGWNGTGRAGIAAAYREYFERVVGDLDSALQQAEAAVRSWPQQWSYHMQRVEVLRKLGRTTEAAAALDRAEPLADNPAQRERMIEIRGMLHSQDPQ